jgi:hypothetical protein
MFLEPYNGWCDNTRPPRDRALVQDEILIFGEELTPPDPLVRLMDDMYTEFMVSSGPVLGPAHQGIARVRPLLYELMDIDPAKRRRAVRRPPFRNLVLASHLLDQSGESLSKSKPERAETYAQLAEWIASQPWPEAPEKATSLRALALIAQAAVFRWKGEWTKAELRFAASFSILRNLPLNYEHILFCQQLSSLREAQGRYDDAHLLLLILLRLEKIRWRYEKPFDFRIVRLALLALKQKDLLRAMELLTSLFPPEGKSSSFNLVELEVFSYIAVCLAAAGLTDQARDLMSATRERRSKIADPESRLSYEWLECRLAVHAGDVEPAIPRLEAIRRWMFRRGNLETICLASIDLALAYAKRGDASQHLPRLVKDVMNQVGSVTEIWAPCSIAWIEEALKHDDDPVVAARMAADMVRQKPGADQSRPVNPLSSLTNCANAGRS